MASGVATRPITDWNAYRSQLNNFVWHSGLIMKPVFAAAHKNPKRIIFSEGESEKVLRAVQQVVDEGLARPILIGRPEVVAKNIERFGLAGRIDPARMLMLPPQGYLEMVGLMSGATLVLTDSGGLQEETTALGVPCLTMRENTERPITVDEGTNTLVGSNPDAIRAGVDEILAGAGKTGRIPEFWDGQAAQRIAADLAAWLLARHQQQVAL